MRLIGDRKVEHCVLRYYILLSDEYIDWYSIQLIVTLAATLAHSAKGLSQPSPRKGQTLPELTFHTSAISAISDMLTVLMVLLKHIITIQYVLAHLNNSVTCVVLVCNLRNLHLCFATIINQS